ncbi:MAG: phosphoribosylanthranilate isomerase [Bacillota bacterium]
MSDTVQVKVCGLTNLEDAQAAVEYGADLIGFIFAASPRQVTLKEAREIIDDLKGNAAKVGVFVDRNLSKVQQIAADCNLDYIQLHGSESPWYCQQLDKPVLKAFSIKDRESLEQLKKYDVDKYLLDTYHPDKLGGTGETFNWDLAVEAKELGPIFLAGGLNPDNVARAVEKVNPAGVDVSSGVELRPGKKNYRKVKQFIQQAKNS